MSKKAPFVAVRTDIRKEEGVGTISEITGYTRDEVLGKLFRMWAWCVDRGLQDAPDDCRGYAVQDAVVVQFLGKFGVDGILGGGCRALAMGERRSDGLIYLHGTSDTVSRLRGWDMASDAADPIVTYAISSGATVKVGKTRDLPKRLRSLQTATHTTLSLIGFMDGDHETRIHAMLDAVDKRIRGEWFTMDVQVEGILDVCGLLNRASESPTTNGGR